jgi:hypothetical protein
MITTLSISPQRGSFQIETYLNRRNDEGKTIENDTEVKEWVEYCQNENKQKRMKESNPLWQEYNLEYDLRSVDWILEKVRTSKSYSQNLYAALCNNDFQKNSAWPILKDQLWSCSWRYAGGIIADMRQQGDYIDWYCSGIREDIPSSKIEEWSEDQKKQYYEIYINYVSEGIITDEIEQDLLKLGWIVVTNND